MRELYYGSQLRPQGAIGLSRANRHASNLGGDAPRLLHWVGVTYEKERGAARIKGIDTTRPGASLSHSCDCFDKFLTRRRWDQPFPSFPQALCVAPFPPPFCSDLLRLLPLDRYDEVKRDGKCGTHCDGRCGAVRCSEC